VHSSLLGIEPTVAALEAAGLETAVVARERGPLGPLMRRRREHLEAAGMLRPGQSDEEVLVVRGSAPAPQSAVRALKPGASRTRM
jgi:release factor glutamine methyltransferase